MSNLINKVKDMVNKDKGNDSRSDNYGPHSSNAANYADPRVDSDLSGGRQDAAYGNTNTYGSTGAGYGGSTGAGYGGSTNVGPHNSNLANKADPRVDSNLDGSRTVGGNAYGSNTTGGYGGSTNVGPHDSNLANRADPRVDSNLDGSRTVGGSGYGSSTGGYGNTPAYDSATTGYGNQGSINAGPHNSNFANKLDPRVDSDMDNRNDPTSRVGGYGTQDNYGTSGANPTSSSGGYGQTGVGQAGVGGTQHHGHHHGHHGHHQQTGAGIGQTGYNEPGYGAGTGVGSTGYNEPGFDNRTGAGVGQTGYNDQYGSSATPGSGNSNKTAGPHNSDMLNKLDPRVDSDLDGSKTYGGNKTNY